MIHLLFSTVFVLSIFVFHLHTVFAKENFLLIDGVSNETVVEFGPDIAEQISPCSTFKIPLSLMGYDAGILTDELTPAWNFQHGYDDWLASWRTSQTPRSWMQYSCVWYSKVLSLALGLEKIQSYLTIVKYGNGDVSGGLIQPGPSDPFWISSSLKISPKEQVNFVQKMLSGSSPFSSYAIHTTKALLFKEELPGGWRLFGKTGWSGSDVAIGGNLEHGWFVGWVEKEDQFFPFAYLIRERKINLDQRIPRTKQLLLEFLRAKKTIPLF